MKKLIIYCILLLPLCACIEKPEGPAERIGRSLDDLAHGIDDMSTEYGDKNSNGKNSDGSDSKNKDSNKNRLDTNASTQHIYDSDKSEEEYQREWEQHYRQDRERQLRGETRREQQRELDRREDFRDF